MAQAQIERTVGNKLWTSERRLLDERFIYLNKSTTKYIVVGVDPTGYEPIMRFCDRATGSHLTLNIRQYPHFVRLVQSVLDFTYNPDDHKFVRDPEFSGIVFALIGNRMWRVTSMLERGSVVTRADTLEKFISIEKIILRELAERDSIEYREIMNDLIQKADALLPDEVLAFVTSELDRSVFGSRHYKVLSDILCHYESLRAHDDMKRLSLTPSATSTQRKLF